MRGFCKIRTEDMGSAFEPKELPGGSIFLSFFELQLQEMTAFENNKLNDL
jgi:hypothetical protein